MRSSVRTWRRAGVTGVSRETLPQTGCVLVTRRSHSDSPHPIRACAGGNANRCHRHAPAIKLGLGRGSLCSRRRLLRRPIRVRRSSRKRADCRRECAVLSQRTPPAWIREWNLSWSSPSPAHVDISGTRAGSTHDVSRKTTHLDPLPTQRQSSEINTRRRAPPWQSNSCSVLQARTRVSLATTPLPCRFPCHYEQCHPRNAVAKHLQLSTSRAHVHTAKPSGSRSTFRADSDGVWHGVAAKGAVFHVKHWTTSLLPLQARFRQSHRSDRASAPAPDNTALLRRRIDPQA